MSIDGLDESAMTVKPFWDEMTWRSDAAKIRQEMERLPKEYQLAVHLVDVEELSYDEAARVLEVPIGTIRSRVFRGREMLRTRLAGVLSLQGGL